jgi:hypothetical protein
MGLNSARNQLEKLRTELGQIVNQEILALEQELFDAKAPYVKGASFK